MKMKRFAVLLGLMLFSFSAQTAAQTLTLGECQQLAEKNYPLIRQYDLIRQTTDYNLSNIARGWLPQISATAQATVQSDVMTLPDPLQNMLRQQGLDMKGLGKGQYRVGLDVNQTVYDGGMIRMQKQVARAEGEVQTAQTAADLYAVRARVNEIFFSVLLLDEKLRLNAEMQAMLQSNLDKLRSMLSNGIAMQRDVNTVMAEKLKAEQQATELNASRKSLMDMLAVFIGKEVTQLVVPQETTVDTQRNNRPERAARLPQDTQAHRLYARPLLALSRPDRGGKPLVLRHRVQHHHRGELPPGGGYLPANRALQEEKGRQTLGRHEAKARPLLRPHPRPARAVSGRTHHGRRPREPKGVLGDAAGPEKEFQAEHHRLHALHG